jgi:Flp pilus assembly protein TadD/predicted Zn-dependent protease with MMP-like domain
MDRSSLGLALVLTTLGSGACHSREGVRTAGSHTSEVCAPKLGSSRPHGGEVPPAKVSDDGNPERPRRVCPAGPDRLETADKAYEGHDYELALSCAEDELLDDPQSATAEHARAAALAGLNQLEAARLAYAHALALDPDDPHTLLGAADLYLSHGGDREYQEIGLEFARRGERRARRRDPELLGQLELLQGMALNDLGRSTEALPKLDEALTHDPKDEDARYERGVALFELCRFPDAKVALKQLLSTLPDDAYTHHELGLVLEQLGDSRGARAELARATELAPDDFPMLLPVSRKEFEGIVAAAIEKLPGDAKRDLSRAKVGVEDLPDVKDLTVDDPPLSPTILGLFRGEPLGDGGTPLEPRAIVLYRENLVRAVHSRDELDKQVKITLWHELGHLRGADDEELRLRGLE